MFLQWLAIYSTPPELRDVGMLQATPGKLDLQNYHAFLDSSCSCPHVHCSLSFAVSSVSFVFSLNNYSDSELLADLQGGN